MITLLLILQNILQIPTKSSCIEVLDFLSVDSDVSVLLNHTMPNLFGNCCELHVIGQPIAGEEQRHQGKVRVT